MTITSAEPQQRRRPALPALATVPVLLVAVGYAVVLLAVSGRYGFFGDELYFLSAGRHLSWGYADQPPMVPLIARVMNGIAPGSLVALRVPVALVSGAGAAVSALIAREFGGDRRSQVLVAACYGLGFAIVSTTLATPVFDIMLWTVLSWLVVRWVRTYSAGAADDRLLLASGIVVAVGVQVKFQILLFAAALLLTSLVLGPRALVRRPMLWAGVLIAAVTTTPTLIWQANHGWPQLEMSSAVAAETALVGPLLNGLTVLLGMGVGIGVVFALSGWWRLFRSPEFRAYRFLGATTALLVAFFLITGGRAHYVYGAFPVLWAVGAVGFQRRRERSGRKGGWLVWPAVALSVVSAVSGLPVYPVEHLAGKPYDPTNFVYLGQIGWPEMARTVGEVYHSLPPEQRATTAIVTKDYWQASALEQYGPDEGLPRPYSGARGFWYFGHPSENATTVLHVGGSTEALRAHFGDIRRVATIDNGKNIETQLQGAPILLATDRQAPWSEIWPEFRRMTLAE